jgi:carboxypeptidase Taq
MSYHGALERRYRRLSHLSHAEAMLAWDEAVMMPTGGGETRAEVLASLRVLVHQESTASAFGELFAGAETEVLAGVLSPWQAANVREMRRGWLRASTIPEELVERASRAESRSEQAWRVLRAKNDFDAFEPLLEEVIACKREVAQVLGERFGLSAYDALLDGYEPGARSAEIAPLFEDLRRFLPDLIRAATEKQKTETIIRPIGPFPIERQKWLGTELMQRVGFDFEHGRLDVSHHPFCGGVPRDVRITTRYDESDFSKSLMGVLHETGHAKYEQHLPAAWLDQPVGRACSMSLHESQSLLMEMQASRSREFMEFLAPLAQRAFPDAFQREPRAFTPDNLYRLYTRVRPDFIRVDADEVTYPCHVILRFEIERDLIEGNLRVKDIPEAWDTAMGALLGLSTRGNFKDGCMQDVHWPAGLFGYFPTYTLGALTAAQLFRAARAAIPELPAQIGRGDFSALDTWLRERVWEQGSRLAPPDLVREATTFPLATEAFKQHVERRYLGKD